MTYIDQLEGVPDAEQSPRSLLESYDGRETEQVDAHFEKLMRDQSSGSENIRGSLCNALHQS